MAADLLDLGRRRNAALLAELAAGDAGLSRRLRGSLHAEPSVDEAARNADDGTDDRYLVGESAAMGRVFREIRQFAACDAPVLITGETGTGKELAARAIHERSRFAAGPFVPINCGGLPPTLIASELFGFEKGAFTGAVQRKMGRIEAARGGTVFLDEIGDLSMELQPHLLRFLQEGTIERLGGQHPVAVSLRVVAATHRPLAEDVAHARFREDLYYRLNILRLHMPALRERGEDIVLLAQFFANCFAPALGQPARPLSADALAAVCAHAWPGNVRELVSRIRRAVVTCEGEQLTAADLGLTAVERRSRLRNGTDENRATTPRSPEAAGSVPLPTVSRGDEVPPNGAFLIALDRDQKCPPLVETRRRLEKWLILTALRQHSDNVTLAAEALGVSRVTLYRLLDKHHLRLTAEPMPPS